MAKEDLLLGVKMGKLEIEPTKTPKSMSDENPFVKTRKHTISPSRSSLQYHKCSCNTRKVVAISKKKTNKIIKDPVLKILQNCSINNFNKETNMLSSNAPSLGINSDLLNLCDLVDNCNQLRISSGLKQSDSIKSDTIRSNKWWKSDASHIKQIKQSVSETSKAGSCSQQALNPPCDVTIDELASYFETLVHIPKKMSSMAEMMYI